MATAADRIASLLDAAKSYIDSQPAMAVVYLEQAEMAAHDAGMPALAKDLFNLYIAAKAKAFR